MRKEISMLKISRIKSKRLKAHLLFAGIFSCLFLWLLFQFKWFGSSEGDAVSLIQTKNDGFAQTFAMYGYIGHHLREMFINFINGTGLFNTGGGIRSLWDWAMIF